MVIFTDALSVLSKLQNPRQKDLNEVETALVDLAAQSNLTQQRIPAHCGVQENEQADRFAREGGQMEQEDRYTSYTDEKTIIKTLSKKKREAATPRLQPVRHPPQTEQTRTGHSVQVENWTQQTERPHVQQVQVGESEMCPCKADIMTAEHLLQHCRLHDVLRRDMWPEPTLLRDKLYGNLEELRRTAAFVRATGISIYRTTKKKNSSHHVTFSF